MTRRTITMMVSAAVIAATSVMSGGIAMADQKGEAARLLTASQATKAAKSTPVQAKDTGCWEALAATCFIEFSPRSPVSLDARPVPTGVSVFRHSSPAGANRDYQARFVDENAQPIQDGIVSVIRKSPKQVLMLAQDTSMQAGWSGLGGLVNGALVIAASCSYGPAGTEQPPAVLTQQQTKALSQCLDGLLSAQLKKSRR